MKPLYISASLLLLFFNYVNSQIDYAEVAFDESVIYNTSDYNKNKSILKNLKNKVRAYPDRLDYRYEFLNALSLGEEWSRFTNEAIKMIEFSYQSKHDWQWHPDYNAIGSDAEGFVLNTVEDYVFMLYITGDQMQFDHLRSICEVVLEYNPEQVAFLTYPAMTYDAMEDYEASMTYLQRAEVIYPDNTSVSLLMAENYENRGMINAAIAYYEKAARIGNEDDVKEAKGHIDRLNVK